CVGFKRTRPRSNASHERDARPTLAIPRSATLRGPMPPILPAQPPRLARELKEMLRLALPLVTGQLSAIGMNVIDAMLAGHLDAHTLGAVAVGTSVWSLALVAAIGVMLALPPSVAQL